MNRTANITFSQRVPTSHIQETGFKQALGYAIMWGNSAHVEIHVDHDLFISCSHMRERKSTSNDNIQPTTREQYFFMGGVWDATTKTYSFHS